VIFDKSAYGQNFHAGYSIRGGNCFEHKETIAHFCMAKYQDITFGLFLFGVNDEVQTTAKRLLPFK